MLNMAKARCEQDNLPRISEAILLLSGLRHITPSVHKLCESADIDLEEWCKKIEESLKPVTSVSVVKEGNVQSVKMDSFSPGAKKVLGLLQRETEALGYNVADSRHLLLALLAHEGGVTQYGLHLQGLVPRKVQEMVMLSLQHKAKRTRSTVPLDSKHLQPLLKSTLNLSGEIAGSNHTNCINEAHLLRAFLSVESMARRIIEDEKVNIVNLRDIAEKYDAVEEEDEDIPVIANIETIRQRLQSRLVGQDNAIERILPHIQRMRFGFMTPDRPVGVFLFCGQSGSGKTEMAKELARAVYGSEENLIFLEMGQFNTPESMNIFVGAPPGYVGYGEGKLTNGLRDKPQAVVLFDEVEKAHSRVLDALLRFLDEGKIDDPAGPVRDGTQCIVIMTSNIGAEKLSQLWKQVENNPNRQSLLRKKLREEFKKHNFRVEFLNRVDELILFHTLDLKDYVEIADRLLKRDIERLNKERKIEVILDPSVAQLIGGYCEKISEGARATQRLTQSVVITPVIDFVLKNSCTLPTRLKVKADCPTDDPEAEPVGIVERG